MTAEQRETYSRPVAERLVAERKEIAKLVAVLKQAREDAGVSLAELEQRTGVQKLAWSRLENATAPNPTVVTLIRYAAAIGSPLQFHLATPNESGE